MEEWEHDFQWLQLRHKFKEVTGSDALPDMKAILFLIGVQEYGRVRKDFSKEDKQDLMHVAACSLLERKGYYKFSGRDEEGWPHWDIAKPFKVKGLSEQESILKDSILDYFKELKTNEGEEE